MITPKGYVRVRDPRTGRLRMEHDLVWEAHFGAIPAGHEIHHRNETKTDNRIENLQLVTRLEHKRLHGGCLRTPSGAWVKPCRRCGVFKPIDREYFYFVGTRGGHCMSICKQCSIAAACANKRRRRAFPGAEVA